MGITAIVLAVIASVFLYVTFNVATIVSVFGFGAALLFVVLEVTRNYSTSSDYVWKEDKNFSIVYCSSFIIFTMAACVMSMKFLA